VLGICSRSPSCSGAAGPGWSLGKELYLGRVEQPQWLGGRVDAKMFLYLFGAVMLELNLLSFGAHHFLAAPETRRPAWCCTWRSSASSVVEYLAFERVHLYTYDFVAERVGLQARVGLPLLLSLVLRRGLWTTAELPDPRWPGWAYALVAAAVPRRAGRSREGANFRSTGSSATRRGRRSGSSLRRRSRDASW
jgi:delta14-sterol reductase